MIGRHRRSAFTGLLGLISLTACTAANQVVNDRTEATTAAAPDFTSVQTRLFSVPGSLSNAWADADNDGDLDLAVSIKGGQIRLYRNNEGTFTDIGRRTGLPQAGDEIRGLSWGDYDGDGDFDLLAGSNVYPTPGVTRVYRNDGHVFIESAAAIGLTIPGRFARQSNWIDFDNDGDLDLYAASRAGSNVLFRNDAGTFSPLTRGAGPRDPRRTVGACWFDMDRDGDLDLFLANQSGDSDALWRNDGSKFVDVAPELGMDQTLRSLREGGVGCAVGDYDNDGDFDLYVATYGANLLYRNNGDATFTEVAGQLQVTEPQSTVGAAWGDYDNDGDLDLMATGYERVDGDQVPSNRLYRNDGGTFTDVINKAHLLNAGDHGVEWVDYDADGDLDLSVTDGYGNAGGHFLFRNNLAPAARARFLAVTVTDARGRALLPGAEVRVFDQSGHLLGARLVSTGGGYNAQSATPVYFGLPIVTPVDVEVRFMGPGGGSVQRVVGIVPGTKNLVISKEADQ